MHNATAITAGSANQRPNTPCIRLWIDVTFRGLEHSYCDMAYSYSNLHILNLLFFFTDGNSNNIQLNRHMPLWRTSGIPLQHVWRHIVLQMQGHTLEE